MFAFMLTAPTFFVCAYTSLSDRDVRLRRILCAVNLRRKVLVYADAYAVIFWIGYGRGYAVYILGVFSV